MTATDLPDGVELSFDDPHPGAIPDIFDFRLLDPDAIRMTYVGTGLAPYTLQRVPADAPLGPWDPEKTYGRNDDTTKPGPVPEAPPAEAGPGSLPDNYQLPRGAPAGR